eukprot:GHVS01063193.1.p1 GENE.GHVS01063193.1~~GHVS01063193.1.p1  ORF type:complete len:292 (+),score=49.62 GHVS01063193.1:49-924(+)
MCVHVSVMCTCYLQQSPEVLQQIHQDTFQAGADVVSTATYQVSVPRLLAEGLGVAEAKEVIASSVQLVKAAAVGAGKPNGQIAGACGPYGAYLADASEYTGNYDIPEEEMKNFHRPRIEALVSSGDLDVLLFETFPSLKESLVVLRLLKEFPDMRGRVWMSFSCKSSSLTCSGENFSQVIAELLQADAHEQFLKCVGVNCVAPQHVAPLAAAAMQRCHDAVRFVAFPNSGETFDVVSNSWINKPQLKWYREYLPIWLKTNYFAAVGGCCRNNVEDVRNIREVVDAWQPHTH